MFGRNLTKEKLIASANYVQAELPVRLAHRIRDFQRLPYICGTNPYMGKVYQMYWNSFDEFRKFKKIETLQDNSEWCNLMSRNMKEHSQIIPLLGMGVSECVGIVDHEAINNFMNRMLMTRISRRTLVEQHIMLSENFYNSIDNEIRYTNQNTNFGDLRNLFSDNFGAPAHIHSASTVQSSATSKAQIVGNVDTQCNVANLVLGIGSKLSSIFEDAYDLVPLTSPQIIIHSPEKVQLMCVTDHIEYILFEILKNSIKATIQTAIKNSGNDMNPNLLNLDFSPIHVTICQSKTHVTIRISDKGGGIEKKIYDQLWNYCSSYKAQFLTNFHRVKEMQAKTNEYTGVSPLISLGFGLPMTRVIANYWGGDISVFTLPGYGVDTYVKLPRLGNVAENLASENLDLEDGSVV
ncbi:[Pyruvate dehydrogenase (acetyl-transferring)] kinase 2, mitochondrial [Smittium culicis]|uniref:Protein-serine/threonine kinase n=1 Tax=Smittium culicis TaxID=133412 RepID=A0A1R1YQI8_9FUNG|nr:[Pyruvate dehydrogenase (acetyl-transferring)] kinase 2, mitochondrial [Smittium culicis]OMJ29152.1 [Pyruvate dehydrogenase (acetyl-transferring)] kinase 2, mitochondrial [Smittium culicis]